MAKPRSRLLSIIRRYFPNVRKVKDATKDLSVPVSAADGRHSNPRDHSTCALAVACKRRLKLDGVVISKSTSYTVKGDTAIRYRTPRVVFSELVSFDRGAGFAPGNYPLIAPTGTQRIGARPDQRKYANKRYHSLRGGPRRFVRYTKGLRTSLPGILKKPHKR